MQKAHLYEALYLVNHGIGEAVRGVQRLNKSPHAFREVYYKSVAGLERRSLPIQKILFWAVTVPGHGRDFRQQHEEME